MRGAIAVDMGATSARFAAGWREDGEIKFEIIEQIPHAPIEINGRLHWDFDRLMAFVKRAADYGSERFVRSTLGIDTWGVDHGFLDREGDLIMPPVAYRDPSHARVYAEMADYRDELYALTGIQHQPFNSIYQLIARRQEDPTLPLRAGWLTLSDLFGYLITREANYDITMASTTQLMGLDNQWSERAFEIAGWDLPLDPPSLPGHIGGYVAPKVRLAGVGSHDTASAVAGLGPLDDETVFLNVGTWSLIGCVVDRPVISEAAKNANLTNERTVDGRVRLLKNVPGFYVINRLHEELGIADDVPTWLATAELKTELRIDLDDEGLFNPVSLREYVSAQLARLPATPAEWAGLALLSLVDALAEVPPQLETVTGRKLTKIKVGGGGSRSEIFCDSLAQASGRTVLRGSAECTVQGNLIVQFAAQDAMNY